MDNNATKFPISIKGILESDGLIPLLENERGDWELPGGKLEEGETPEICVEREIEEELGVHVTADHVIDCWVYEVLQGVRVFVVTYACTRQDVRAMRLSEEHQRLSLFHPDEIDRLIMPQGYKDSIGRWLNGQSTVISSP